MYFHIFGAQPPTSSNCWLFNTRSTKILIFTCPYGLHPSWWVIRCLAFCRIHHDGVQEVICLAPVITQLHGTNGYFEMEKPMVLSTPIPDPQYFGWWFPIQQPPNRCKKVCFTSTWVDIAVENGHWNSWFTHKKWWFSIAMLVYQRVTGQWVYQKTVWSDEHWVTLADGSGVADVQWKLQADGAETWRYRSIHQHAQERPGEFKRPSLAYMPWILYITVLCIILYIYILYIVTYVNSVMRVLWELHSQ